MSNKHSKNIVYAGTKIELKISGKTRYFSKENKAQIPNFVLIGIIWADLNILENDFTNN